jgi:predicted nuclease with TOPRIM domain
MSTMNVLHWYGPTAASNWSAKLFTQDNYGKNMYRNPYDERYYESETPPAPLTTNEKIEDLAWEIKELRIENSNINAELSMLQENISSLMKVLSDLKDQVKGFENLLSIDNSTRVNLRR